MGLAQSKRSLRTGKTHDILHESWSTNINFHFSTDVVNKYTHIYICMIDIDI